MNIAKSYGLTGPEYMWLGTNQIYTISQLKIQDLPIGMIGKVVQDDIVVRYRVVCSEVDNSDILYALTQGIIDFT